MNPLLLGGWPSIQAFAEGVQTQTAIFSLFGEVGNLRWLLGAMLVAGFAMSVLNFLKTKNVVQTLWMVTAVVWVSMVLSPVQVSMPTPTTPQFHADMNTSIRAAQEDLRLAGEWVVLAKSEAGQPQLEAAAAAERQAREDISRLQALSDQGSNGKIGVVSAPFAFIFTMCNAVALNVWEAIDGVAWNKVSLVDRAGQAAIAKQLSFQPGLSAEQRQVASNLATCLAAKQVYGQQLVKITGWVKQGIQPAGRSGLAGEELNAAWVDVLLPSRQKAEGACYGADDALYASIDGSISDAESQSFNHAFSYDLPLIGRVNFWKYDTDEKQKMLAGQIGVEPNQLDGKSSEQISKMFLRSQKMAAISGELQSRIQAAGTGMAMQSASGMKADAGGWMAELLGGFAQAAEPFMRDTLNLCLKFVVAFFPVAFLLSLIPGQWKKAILAYVFALMFVLGWQVMWLTIEKHAAEFMRSEVAAQGGSGNVFETTSRLLAGTWNNLTGGAGTGEVVVAGAVGARAAATSAGRQALMTFLAAAKGNPPGAVLSTIASGVVVAVDSGVDAAAKLKGEQANFDKMLRGEIGVSPALAELASGVIDVQREELMAMHKRTEMNRAVWMLASPFLTIIFLLGGWAGIGTAAGMAGPMVAQIGQSVGSTLGGAATRLGGKGLKMGKGV